MPTPGVTIMSRMALEDEHHLGIIKVTLVQFDALCNELERAKKEASMNYLAIVEHMKAQLNGCLAEKHELKADFETCQASCRDLIAGNVKKNARKLDKLYQKIQDDVDRITAVQEKARELEANIAAIEQQLSNPAPSIDELKRQYNTAFEIIKGFRDSVPAMYHEAERQTGVHFFTLPVP